MKIEEEKKPKQTDKNNQDDLNQTKKKEKHNYTNQNKNWNKNKHLHTVVTELTECPYNSLYTGSCNLIVGSQVVSPRGQTVACWRLRGLLPSEHGCKLCYGHNPLQAFMDSTTLIFPCLTQWCLDLRTEQSFLYIPGICSQTEVLLYMAKDTDPGIHPISGCRHLSQSLPQNLIPSAEDPLCHCKVLVRSSQCLRPFLCLGDN